MAVVMRRLQGPDLALLLPFVAAWFAGHVLIATALRQRHRLARAAFWLIASVPALIALGGVARQLGAIPARALGLCLLAALSGSLALIGFSLFSRPEKSHGLGEAALEKGIAS
jgi:hypothetical protein